MEYVNLANLEWFTALHCICIAIVCVFQFGDGTGESRQSDGDKRAKAGSVSLWGSTWGWWFCTAGEGPSASLVFSSPLNQKLVLSEEPHTDLDFLKIRKTYDGNLMKQSWDCNVFSLFSPCPEKLTCFPSEMEERCKQIWGNWFAFSWFLKVSGHSSSRM